MEKGGPADKAGVKEKDIITELDGRSVANMEQLQGTLQYYAAGEKVKITVERADSGKYKEQTLDITLGSAKEQEKEGA
ncbi:MAG TPA: PDZ domain-containing protein [Candidatus Scatomonas merdigallinarum]|nr:PDZ domain-containing protein [Candidatus Scatomonas merdigallinarum]